MKKNKPQIRDKTNKPEKIKPPKKRAKTIFEILFDEEICFAVSVSSNKFISSEFLLSSNEYHIMILGDDLRLLKKYAFYKSDNYNHLYERKLSTIEIEEFKSNQEKFIKRIHSQDLGQTHEIVIFDKWVQYIVICLRLRTIVWRRNAFTSFQIY